MSRWLKYTQEKTNERRKTSKWHWNRFSV